MTLRTIKLALLAAMLVLVLAPAAAFAALAPHGPVVPYIAGPPATGNGYPRYYKDQNGVAVDLQVPPFGDLLHAPTMIYGPVVDPLNQFSVDIGFDLEVFYFMIQPDPKSTTFAPPLDSTDPQGKLRLGKFNPLIGLEAGFANTAGTATEGEQYVFQRVRFLWNAAPDGFYRFSHPYGFMDMVASGGSGLKANNGTIDTPGAPIGIPFTDQRYFGLAEGGEIGPFLFQVNPPVQFDPLVPHPPAPYDKPTDWLGDGVTAATFTGSPLNPPFNAFRLEAFTDSTHTTPLNLWPAFPVGATTNVIETNLGQIAGHRLHFPITGPLDLLLSD